MTAPVGRHSVVRLAALTAALGAAVGIFFSIAATQAPAAAAAKTIPSELNVLTTTQIDPETIVGGGTVISEEKRCLANREVKLIVKTSEGSKLFDLARTSKNGGWLVRGDSSVFIGYTAAAYKLLPRTVKVNGKELTCGKDKVSLL